MSLGQRIQERREELGITRAELARRLGVTSTAVANYEGGKNALREDLLLKLFQVLDVDPNYLYQDALMGQAFVCSVEEQSLVRKYRALATPGRQTLHAVADALGAYQAELEAAQPPAEVRQIPLYRCPAAAGLAAPVFGEDFDYMDVAGDVPRGAELAVRIQGDSMEPGSGTARWSTSTTTPSRAGTWASSAWTGRWSASSTSGTPWEWCTSSP